MNVNRSQAFWFLTALYLATATQARPSEPVITDVRTEGANLGVTVKVPAGLQRLTLESGDRLGRKAWTPRAVMQLDGKAGEVTFRLPMSRSLEVVRVRCDTNEPLPAAFYQGTNSFSAPYDSSGGLATDGRAGPIDQANPSGADPGSVRDVVESDIWQLRGDTLYFFNQYRGLQIIDLQKPDAPFIRGLLPLPAAGDQMYLLDSKHVVLLAYDGCAGDQSQVVVVADTGASPTVVARLPVPGSITESRLVGTALYVASQTSRPVDNTTNTVWEWGTMVSAFDLSDPSAPVARNTLWYPGYGNVVTATDTYLFVVTQSSPDWWRSTVNLIDITDPSGKTAGFGSIQTAGQVSDKFKLNYSGGVFCAISEDWHGKSAPVTRVETFRVPDPRSAGPAGIVKLGQLALGNGERLHATRFDGARVYAVTFYQVDPLWVIDLSDPAVPRIAGSVAVPGWSTYIAPLGDRLVTMGIESNRVAVSLFNVTDPAAPALVDRVKLGANYSWSEANYDEKAFTVLPDAGLLLVPFSGDATNGYASALQLIDYSPNGLKARGQVWSESGISYRRATALNNRLLSLSDWELLSVDATDRDHPQVSSRLELAASVDRVILAGDYLLEISAGNGWDISTPVLRVASASEPDKELARLDLKSMPALGATTRGDRLYVAQGLVGFGADDSSSKDPNFILTVVSLSDLPELSVLSQTATNAGPLGWTADWQAFWPSPGVLVWASGMGYWGGCRMCPIPMNGGPIGIGGGFWPYWRGSGGSGYLVAFDTTAPDSPQFAAQVNLNDTNRWGFSRAFLADGLVYLSHQTSEQVSGTNAWTWVYKTFLDVVDFGDPSSPIVRAPVNIPNRLVGVADSGALLFTVGAHWNSDPAAPWRDYLDASAYDGVSAHLVDSLPLSTSWPHPVLVAGADVLVGDPAEAASPTATSPALRSWTISAEGNFVLLDSLRLKSPVTDLASFSGLGAGTASDSTIVLFDPTDPSNLRAVGSAQLPVCWSWPDLAHADGDLARGLWVPLGAYGVTQAPVSR